MSCWTSLAESHLLRHVGMPLWYLKYVKKKLLYRINYVQGKIYQDTYQLANTIKTNNMKAMTKGLEQKIEEQKKFSNSDIKYHYS
jgi:hypothetical protein